MNIAVSYNHIYIIYQINFSDSEYSDTSDNDNEGNLSVSSSSISQKSRTKLSLFFNMDRDDKKNKFGTCKLYKQQKIIKNIKMKDFNTTGLKRHLKNTHGKEFRQLYGLTSKHQQLLNFQPKVILVKYE